MDNLIGMSSMTDHPATPSLLSMGAQALMSGKVSPEEVEQAKAALQTPQGQSAVMKYLNPASGKKDPITGRPLPTMSKSDNKKSTDNKTTTTKTIFDTDQMAQTAKAASELPGIADERKGIGEMQDMLNMRMANQPNDQSYLSQGLAGLADAWSGSHLSESLPKLETQAQRNDKNFAAMGELQKRKSDLNKLIFEGAKAARSGTQSDMINQLTLQNLTNQIGSNKNDLAGTRQQALAINAGKDYDNDKMLLPMGQALNSSDKAMGVISGKTPVTTAMMNTLQEDLTRMMNPGGVQVADAKLQRETTKFFDQLRNNAASYFGKINDLRVTSPDMFKQLKDMLNQVREDSERAYDQRIAEKEANYFNAEPNVKEVSDRKAAMLRKARLGGRTLAQKAEAAAGGGGGAPAVDHSKMTNAELAAWLKENEGK